MPPWLSLSVLLFFTATTIILGIQAVRLGVLTLTPPTGHADSFPGR